MPLFADLAAMQARFEARDLLQLTDDDNSGSIDTARIDQELTTADALIKSYVAARHQDAEALAGNAVLTDIACDLAFSRLYRSNQPEWVKERHKAAIKSLQDISSGKIKLDGGTEEAPPRPGQIRVTSDTQRFGRDKLGSY